MVWPPCSRAWSRLPVKGRNMEATSGKKAAGAWLREKLLDRLFSAGMLAMGVSGFAVGFTVREFFVFDRQGGHIALWGMLALIVLVLGVSYLFYRRLESTWGQGLAAERRVGDLIEHAVAQPGCAFAHDVREALGGAGNVDHVVMTPAGVWVVETKARRLSKRRFPQALRQAVENARRVRRHLVTSLPVRSALVIADHPDGSPEKDYDLQGETVTVFGPKTFWRLLRRERDRATGGSAETTRVERMVWSLGSTRYLDS